MFIFTPEIDAEILLAVQSMRIEALDSFVAWFTNNGPVVATAFLYTFLLLKKNFRVMFLILLSSAFAFQTVFLLKILIQGPRPYELLHIQNIATASFSSFPSTHAAYMFAVLPALAKRFKAIGIIWFFLAIMTGFSRMYVGVHFLSDVVGGLFIGIISGYFFEYLEKKYAFLEKIYVQIKDKTELRRQIAHALTGIAIIVLARLGYVNVPVLAVLLILGGALSLLCTRRCIPIICQILSYFERPSDLKKFPGKGPFFLVLGAMMAMILFQRDIAFAAIGIMAVGDSITNIVGSYFGTIPNPFNPKKNIEGTIMATLASTLICLYFVPFFPGLVASTLAMFIESLDLRIGRFILDDNFLVPLVSGGILTLWNL